MALDDFVEPEIAVTAAVAAAIFSPRARKFIRKGLVYGMAGVIVAGDAVTSFAKSVGQGMQQASAEAMAQPAQTKKAEENAEPETTTASPRKTAAKTEDVKPTKGRGGKAE